VRRTITLPFVGVYSYFGLAGALSSSLLGNGASGMLQVLILFLLAAPVADSVGGRRVRRFLEGQLTSADQHVQYSTYARGLMHNLRNTLGVAMANLEVIDVPDDQDQAAAYEAVRIGLGESHEALQQTVSEGRAPTVAFSRLDIGELAGQTGVLLRRFAAQRGVSLTVRPQDYPAYVFGHAGLLREVLTNLILNGLEACRRGGLVVVSYQSTDAEVQVNVADTGHGVDDQTALRLFEPGFSTKGPKGTGLGLYTSLGIARQHAGDLRLAPSGDGRTTFVLTLPTYDRGVSLLSSRL